SQKNPKVLDAAFKGTGLWPGAVNPGGRAPMPDKDLMEGIYELEGDALKICYAYPGKGRPAEFASKADPATGLVVLRREPPAGGSPTKVGAADESQDKRPPLAEEIDRLRGTWRSGEKAAAAVEVKFTKARDGKLTVSQTWKRLGTSATGVDIRYEPKEEGGARFLECRHAFEELDKLPQKMEFRFEKDALILKVADGPFQGEHRLGK